MNRPADLEKALVSVLAQTRLPEEIWVIDQSTDERSKVLCERLSAERAEGVRIRYVYQEEKSLVKARNRGIGLVTGEILSFLDDDIVLDADYFEKIHSEFVKDPKLAGVSGNARVLENWHGWRWGLRKALSNLFLISHYDGRMTLSGLGYPIFDHEITRVMNVEMLPGCNMNFRVSSIKGETFDEYFSGYSYREDAEYSYRISKRGALRQIPDARLWHYYSTSNRLSEAELRKMKVKNYDHMFRKFKGRDPVARLLFLYTLMGLTVIDLIEYLTQRSGPKKDKLRAGLTATRSVLRGHD